MEIISIFIIVWGDFRKMETKILLKDISKVTLEQAYELHLYGVLFNVNDGNLCKVKWLIK